MGIFQDYSAATSEMISFKSNSKKDESGMKWVIVLCDELQISATHDFLIFDILK